MDVSLPFAMGLPRRDGVWRAGVLRFLLLRWNSA
jgi:hypothetical protein